MGGDAVEKEEEEEEQVEKEEEESKTKGASEEPGDAGDNVSNLITAGYQTCRS